MFHVTYPPRISIHIKVDMISVYRDAVPVSTTKELCNYIIESDNDDYLEVIASVYTDNASQWVEELRAIFDSKFTTRYSNNDYDAKYHDEMIKTFCKYVSRRISIANPDTY